MPFFSSFTGSFSGGRRKPISIGGGGYTWSLVENASATVSTGIGTANFTNQRPPHLQFRDSGNKLTFLAQDTVPQGTIVSMSTAYDVANGTATNFAGGFYTNKPVHWINANGTKVYAFESGVITGYELSIPYDIGAVWSNGSGTATSLGTATVYNSISFHNDITEVKMYDSGAKMIIMDDSGRSIIFDLSTNYDPLSATVNTSNTSTTTVIYDGPATWKTFTWSDDGATLFGFTGARFLRQYTASTPWDIDTLTLVSSKANPDGDRDSFGFELDHENGRLYFVRQGSSINYWDIGVTGGGGGGAATYTVSGATQSATTQLPGGALVYLNYNADGTEVTTTYNLSKQLYTVALPTPYDPTSGVANYDSGDPNEVINLTAGSLAGFRYNNDGTKAFFTHQYANSSPSLVSGHISEFSLSTAYDIFSISSSPNALYDVTGDWYGSNSFNITDINFNTDGSKMFITNSGGLSALGIFEYDLSTEFDLSTATYSQGFDFATDMPSDILPRFGTFNSAGTKFYMADIREEYVYEFDLSTGFDVSTMSYNGVFLDISGIDTGLRQVGLSQDETQLYVTGAQNNRIYTFDLVQE